MRIDIVTLFPEMFAGVFEASIIGRARASGAIEIGLHNPRDYTHDKHRVVDDYAYGGGPGMVMKPEPLFECVDAVRAMDGRAAHVVLLTPQGRTLDHTLVAELAARPRLIVICGHYEGVDERVRERLADVEVSIGDYVLSGGEPAAIVLADAVARHQPGVLGSEQSLEEESHAQGLLEYSQYTRPPEYRGMAVPEVLLSGHHADVAAWRRRQSIERTARRRPDLLARVTLTPAEQRWADEARADASEPNPRPRLARIVLPSSDIERDGAFYARLLGVGAEPTATGSRRFVLGNGTIELTASEDAARAASTLYVSMPDIKAAYASAKESGAAWVDSRIRREATGERTFRLRDHSGNTLVFLDETDSDA